ncbi:hypothetical protein [Methanobrevibacter sp.]|uniref:hypothetical protein n=1 Tax=Methanobrevibacter sp. TaxID=66852 RepID=UPI00388D39DC
MNVKKKILVLSIILIFVSVIGVYASDIQQNNYDTQAIMDNFDEDDLTGCCSVVCQLNDNSSIMSFRRDAKFGADIHIENIDWHGIPAIKQYKVDGGYFCQVIVTNEGWIIGYGGIDDGSDNEKIENITSTMISNDSSISEDGLKQIQEIKHLYKMGHVIIKAPNGNYGIATANETFTGHLEDGEYVSIPNRIRFFRSGNLTLNSTDKIADMAQLATSDAFGLVRRDISTFYFHPTEDGDSNVTDIYISNDDGSVFGLNCLEDRDDVYINNTVIKAEDIPVAPDYKQIGSYVFPSEPSKVSNIITLLTILGFVIFVGVLAFVIWTLVVYVRYMFFNYR